MSNRENINAQRHFLAPALAIAVVFGIVGCYTILKHPVTSEEGKQLSEEHPQEYYRQNCLDCHADYSEYPYGYFYGDYPEYYFEYPRWGYYYAYPWWWDRHWYDAPELPEDHPLVEGEKASRRGGLAPPYVGGAPALNTGGIPTGGYSSGAATGGKTQPGGSGTGAGGQQGEKTRVRASDVPDTTSTDTNKTDAAKAPRRGGKKP